MDKNRLNSLKILHKILFHQAKMKDAMKGELEISEGDVDRAFIMELVYGCVRNKIYLEWILGHFVRNLKKTRKRTRTNLLMALYQILFTNVPDWASVHETVEIEKFLKGQPSFVNAVLRNFLRNRDTIHLPPLAEEPIEHISLSTSHPEWLIRKWRERFPVNELIKFAKANNTIPPLTIRVNTLTQTTDTLQEILDQRNIDFASSHYCPDALILKNVPINQIHDLIGDIFVQDEASQIITYLLNPQQGNRVLDACAAPGGKCTHVAQITENQAEIVAVEQDARRMRILEENREAFHATSIKTLKMNVLDYHTEEMFERILVDAPCSALGVIRRNPDIKYRHSPDELTRYGNSQLEILLHASRFLKEGGLLVYSVCSTEPEETIEVANEFLNITGNFYIIDGIDDISIHNSFKRELRKLMGSQGFLFTYPHTHNMDGFFAVRFTKK